VTFTVTLSSRYFPIFLDLSNFRVLVIGGGKVGTKRALRFKDYGAKVTVVTLQVSEELQRSGIELIINDARSLVDDISKYDIIVTATNDRELNSMICRRAIEMRKLCNNPTNPKDSNFIVPIFYEDGDIAIAVSTMGKSSIVSKLILDQALNMLRSNESIMLSLKAMAKVKEILKARVSDPSLRYTLYHKIFEDEEFERHINNGEIDSAIRRAEEIMNEVG